MHLPISTSPRSRRPTGRTHLRSLSPTIAPSAIETPRFPTIVSKDAPQRLRTVRFQELIAQLRAEGIEACLSDDPYCRVLTPADESPGINAKLRLRLRGGTAPSGELDLSALGEVPRRTPTAAVEGGPRIVLQTGEKPIPQQVARPSDYNLAVLRLQFLTAVPSAERGRLPAWPDGYLLAATRGLVLRDQERGLLRAYAAGLCVGNHSPFDAIPRLSQVLSSTEWDELLGDFQALNPFQPELVQAIVAQVTPVTAPRSQPNSWQVAAQPPADFVEPALPPMYPLQAEPLAAAGRREPPADTVRDEPANNKRDLGALSDMFDDE